MGRIRVQGVQSHRRLALPAARLALTALLAAGCAGEPSKLAEIRLPERAAGGTDPAVAVVPRGRDLLLAWLADEGAGARLWFARTADAGATWSAPVAVTPPGERFGAGEGAAPRIACDLDGRVALAWLGAADSGSAATLRLARSLDGGRTWAPPVSPVPDSVRTEMPDGFDLAGSDDGRLLLAWLDRAPAPGAAPADSIAGGRWVRVLRSQDFGGEWLAGRVTWPPACANCRVAAGLDLVGVEFVAYRRLGPEMRRDVMLAWRDGYHVHAFADHWSAAGCPGAGPSLTVARDGTLRVAWYTGAPGRTGVWFRQGIPETYDSTVTPLAILARDGLPAVHVATGDAGRLGTLVACDADSAGPGGLTLVRIEASGRRVLERLVAPGVRDAGPPRLAASNTSPRAYVAWSRRADGAVTRSRLYRWDLGR